MKSFKMRLADRSKPTEWPMHGEDAQDALERWNQCFDHAGGKFEVVGHPATRAVAR